MATVRICCGTVLKSRENIQIREAEDALENGARTSSEQNDILLLSWEHCS